MEKNVTLLSVESGAVDSSKYNHRYLRFEWSIANKSIENGTTTINYVFKGAGEGSPRYYTSGNFKLLIDNQQVYFSSKRIHLYDGTVIAEGQHTFFHDSEGNKTFSVYIEGAIYKTSVNVSGSSSFELPQLARASNPTVSGNLYLGNNITINTNRASSSFTHTLRYAFDSTSGTIATGVGSSITWTLPKSLANQIPRGTSGTLTIYCDTYSGSTLIGTKNVAVTIYIPDTTEFYPGVSSCNLSEAVSGIAAQFGGYVQSRSKINGSVSASGVYGSTIKSYSVAINGATYSSNNFTTDFLTGSGTLNCVVTVTDTRNRSVSKTYAYNVLAYTSPTPNTLSINRCDSDGTINDEADNAKVIINAIISDVENKNTKKFNLYYKKQSDSNYIKIELPDDDYILNYETIISNIDVDYEYDFKLEIIDFFGSVTQQVQLGSGFTLLDFDKNGRSLAVGKVSQAQGNEKLFDVGIKMKTVDVEVNGNLYLNSGNAVLDYEVVEEWED